MIHHSHRHKGALQTVLIPKHKFDLEQAKGWLEGHHYPFHKVDETPDYFRFRQQEPVKGAHYYSKKLPNGVDLVFEK
jgi:hypothetical protein